MKKNCKGKIRKKRKERETLKKNDILNKEIKRKGENFGKKQTKKERNKERSMKGKKVRKNKIE